MQNEEYYEQLEARKQEQLPIVLTASEAMDILSVGKNTMYRLLNSGELAGIRIGRSWRITNIDIERFLLYSKNLKR